MRGSAGCRAQQTCLRGADAPSPLSLGSGRAAGERSCGSAPLAYISPVQNPAESAGDAQSPAKSAGDGQGSAWTARRRRGSFAPTARHPVLAAALRLQADAILPAQVCNIKLDHTNSLQGRFWSLSDRSRGSCMFLCPQTVKQRR